jgi:transcriptional regulator with XRE-family HTH domain
MAALWKLGEIVRELREARGLSQAQLAELAQIALSYVVIIESDRQAPPPRAIVQRLAKALGVPVQRLLETER